MGVTETGTIRTAYKFLVWNPLARPITEAKSKVHLTAGVDESGSELCKMYFMLLMSNIPVIMSVILSVMLSANSYIRPGGIKKSEKNVQRHCQERENKKWERRKDLASAMPKPR